MATQLISLFLIFGLAVGLAIPIGRYLSQVYSGKTSFLDFLAPLERLIYRICRIDPAEPMTWQTYLLTMLAINGVWLLWGFVMLLVQADVPFWNPQPIPSMEWTLALNTAISFLTSTNLQHYSGETGATYFTQMAVLTFLQFVSAGTSLATGVALVRGLQARSGTNLGNFYNDLLKSCTRVLLPLSIVVGILLMLGDVPMTFKPYESIVTLQGDSVTVARGPVAAMLPIKHLGSNGGGFFGPNTAHPMENPSFFTYVINLLGVLLLPLAFVSFVGYFLNRRKFSIILFAVMTACFLILTVPIMVQEMGGNKAISAMGIRPLAGSMEGKEARFGTLNSAFYCGVNIVIPAGTLVSLHDSYTPLSGLFMLVGMQLDAFYGGLGTGFMYMFIYIVIAIFIGNLMIGRTPELLGKKVSIREMQIASAVIVAQPLLYLGATAVATAVYTQTPDAPNTLKWLSNTGYHGFTTMLYEYVSSAAGNGSGFEGLGDNTPFWNLSTALVMLFGRFIPIIGPVAIGGLLFNKQFIPPSSGTLPTESYTFGFFLTAIIFIIGALCFFPALALGPIADFLTQ